MINPQLLITNIFIIACLIITFVFGFFIYRRDPNNLKNITLFLLTLSIDVFYISHFIGINTYDPIMSQKALMWNAVNIFIALFSAHLIYAYLGLDKARKTFLYIMYGTGIALTVFFIMYPATFLLPSEPKMYYPNYYEPGSLYWLMRVHFLIAALVPIYHLFQAFRKSEGVRREQMKYLFLGFIYGYGIGIPANFLIYDIPVDPMWAMLFGLYTIPFAYGVLKYNLWNINVVAKSAALFAAGVAAVSLLIIAINSTNAYLIESVPDFPLWFMPVISAIIAVAATGVIWYKIREVDVLKYEFINVVTHKFRTPLTSIKWSAQALVQESDEEIRKESIAMIQTSSERLNELTNMILSLSTADKTQYYYTYAAHSLKNVVEETFDPYRKQMEAKKIAYAMQADEGLPDVRIDKDKIKFALQNIIENAIRYMPEGGSIGVKITKKDFKKVMVSIKDSGVGIPSEELPYVFTKFYRGKSAKHIDTEGMGISLYMAKEIVERHGGEIRAESNPGEKGSTFSVVLPAGE